MFESGFTTKSELTEVSGRGVGLGIVKSKIEDLKGSLKIRTRKNVGTRFTMSFPLSITISKALLVQIQDQVYAISMDYVERMIKLNTEKIDLQYLSLE